MSPKKNATSTRCMKRVQGPPVKIRLVAKPGGSR